MQDKILVVLKEEKLKAQIIQNLQFKEKDRYKKGFIIEKLKLNSSSSSQIKLATKVSFWYYKVILYHWILLNKCRNNKQLANIKLDM